MSCRLWQVVLLFFCVAVLPVQLVSADPQSQSFSTIKQVDDHITLRFTVAAREVTRLAALRPSNDLDALLRDYIGQKMRISVGPATLNAERKESREEISFCTLRKPPESKAAKAGYKVAELQFDCPPQESGELLRLHNQTFFDLISSHVHFAKFKRAGGKTAEQLFTSRQRVQAFSLDASAPAATQGNTATVFAYIALGFEHILEGLDHIVFLLSLLLLSNRLRDVVLIVTGFTLGHSITLSLAVLGVLKPNVLVVEAVIGFTIALVAAENIGIRAGANRAIGRVAGGLLALLALLAAFSGIGPSWLSLLGLALFSLCYLSLSNNAQAARRYRPLITSLFGLVHGFGFANVLMEVGIPATRLLPALFGFNVGVELGQLAIVFMLWLLGAALLRLSRTSSLRLPNDVLSALLCAVGVYWFVQRGFF